VMVGVALGSASISTIIGLAAFPRTRPYGEGKVVFAAGILGGTSILCWVFSHAVWQLILLAALQGFATRLWLPTVQPNIDLLVRAHHKDRLALAFCLPQSGQVMGMMAGWPVVTYIVGDEVSHGRVVAACVFCGLATYLFCSVHFVFLRLTISLCSPRCN